MNETQPAREMPRVFTIRLINKGSAMLLQELAAGQAFCHGLQPGGLNVISWQGRQHVSATLASLLDMPASLPPFNVGGFVLRTLPDTLPEVEDGDRSSASLVLRFLHALRQNPQMDITVAPASAGH